MRKLFAGVALLYLLAACDDKKVHINPFAAITSEVDSIRDNADTTHHTPSAQEPEPIVPDEPFDEFIYSFASDTALQKQRIVFPLSYYKGDQKKNIEKRYWKHDELFVNQSYYTLLLDREQDMDLVGDINLTSVQVEWIFLRTRMMKRYYFERKKGVWMLEAINLCPMEKKENEDFFDFFARFATDSLFQSQRVRNPLKFVTTDPDDDFSILETTLDLNQWFAFKPALPADRLSNVNYGQQNNENSPIKIMILKGVGNGFSNILYFQRKDENWELVKFEDTSM